MLSLGALSFSAPWLLAAALALPALWWLLRATPPPPRRFDFPAIRLLFGLTSAQQTAQSAPLWLILLRLALILLVIIGASGPAWHRDKLVTQGPWLIVVDNGWSAAKYWPLRRERLLQFVAAAERDHQPVALLPTTTADGSALAVSGPLPAEQARSIAEALQPQPWPGDRKQALKALSALPHGRAMRVIWISDGLDDGAAANLAESLQTYGRLEIALPAPQDRAEILMPPTSDGGDMVVRLLRPAGGPARKGVLRALDDKGRSLALLDIDWATDATGSAVSPRWPSELRNRVARLVIDGEDSAAATVLLDGGWSRHAVGLVDHGGNDRIPLLDDLFYGDRAVSSFAEVRRGSVDTLLQRPLSLIIMPDHGALAEGDRALLRRWVEAGGTLLRFAGPELAGNPDDLLPVRLRVNERLLGGSLSWAEPLKLAPMPDSGPFAGLAIPDDLTVSAQILAEPDLTLADKTWAKLVDGTPLVTGAQRGKGWLVLVHTTAWPGWSNLALSGLFPEMLHRLLDRSQGVAMSTGDRPLPALEQLDGFGHLIAPRPATESWPAGTPPQSLGPRHPPGYYGAAGLRRAVNLAPTLDPLRKLDLPGGAILLDLAARDRDRDLMPACLGLALLLLLIDLLALTGLRRAAAALLLGILAAPQSWAADDIAAILDTRLAYVLTGDSATDDVSRQGLAALSRQVVRRTTALLAEPAGVDLEHDELSVYPLLYWPLTAGQQPLKAAALARLNDFLRHGGLLLIDSRDGGGSSPERMRSLTRGIDIPALAIVNERHVLAKSFYLLHDFPGRVAGATLFAEQTGDSGHDFVSPVLIGGNDYAAAWALDRQGEPLFPAIPGGEAQRETALRFGVNLVIYALTGSYKADQVHVPAILERMHR